MRDAQLVVDGAAVSPLLVTEGFGDRLRGMLGRRPLPPALLLTPCDSVHTMWMHAPLDVAALDAHGRVVTARTVRPWRMTRPRKVVRAVLEAPEGSFARWGLAEGSTVTIDEHEVPGI